MMVGIPQGDGGADREGRQVRILRIFSQFAAFTRQMPTGTIGELTLPPALRMNLHYMLVRVKWQAKAFQALTPAQKLAEIYTVFPATQPYFDPWVKPTRNIAKQEARRYKILFHRYRTFPARGAIDPNDADTPAQFSTSGPGMVQHSWSRRFKWLNLLWDSNDVVVGDTPDRNAFFFLSWIYYFEGFATTDPDFYREPFVRLNWRVRFTEA